MPAHSWPSLQAADLFASLPMRLHILLVRTVSEHTTCRMSLPTITNTCHCRGCVENGMWHECEPQQLNQRCWSIGDVATHSSEAIQLLQMFSPHTITITPQHALQCTVGLLHAISPALAGPMWLCGS
jgi:hypothetical protein